MAEFNETVIDHVSGDDWCGVSTGEQWVITKLKQLADKYPDEVECISDNQDGSVYYHMPWKYVHVFRPRVLSEEAKAVYTATIKAVNDARAERSKSTRGRVVNESNLRENTEVE